MTNPSPHSQDTALDRDPTREGVLAAATRIAALIPPTPLLPLTLPSGETVWCKAECLQPVGSFKIRGAWNRLATLDAAQRARGVVAVSSGNHAQGVAWAAARLGVAATIVMPADAPAVKLAATRALGATVVTYDRKRESRDAIAAALVAETGGTLVHAFANAWVIEGQGTMGLEIAAQMQARAGGAPTRIVCSCGGGGMSAGLALACPEAQIVPVEPEHWDDVTRSLRAGSIQQGDPMAPDTACDALQTLATFPINFRVLQAHGMQGATVSEAEVHAAQRLAFERLRLVVEPGGAAALAAVMAGKARADGRTAVVLSGGSVDRAAYAAMLAGPD